MVKDRKAKGPAKDISYALKVQKSAEHYTEAAMDEVELLDCISAERKKSEATLLTNQHDKEVALSVDHSRFVATLYDSFFHSGPNGRHMCMVFSMLGCNLLSVIKAYNYRGIPVPVVKTIARGVCKGLDFLHRNCHIIHTDLKPENVLLQFPHHMNTEEEIAMAMAAMTIHENDTSLVDRSREELDSALNGSNASATTDERKKARKAFFGLGKKNDSMPNNTDKQRASMVPGVLSDLELGKVLTQAGDSKEPYTLPDEASDKIRRRPGHCTFVTTNFGPHRIQADSTLLEIMQKDVDMLGLSEAEVEASLLEAEAECGLAEVSLFLRAFTPKDDLADTFSRALGVKCDTQGNSRVWRVLLSLPSSTAKQENSAPRQGSSHPLQVCFQIRQLNTDADNEALTDIASLISENINPKPTIEEEVIPELSDQRKASQQLPASTFSIRFPARATNVVFGFIESRIPGVVFLSYSREDGSPPLDNVLFGPNFKNICNHPYAMRVKADPVDPSHGIGSCIFGFDLRLINDFSAQPMVDEDGVSTFALMNGSNELISEWWLSRNPIQERVKAFTGMDPINDIIKVVGADGRESRKSSMDNDRGFHEGGKKPGTTSEASTAPSSRDTSASSAARISNQQPDLKNVDLLLKCRAVIVDLGNACWTHRHFSEDIQTRQYRAPEVLVGSTYDTSADIWSLGCMTFELLTGDLLFDPRAGDDYDRDEDHLAMFQELLGKMPKQLALAGKYSKNFFDKRGNLKRIKQLKFWPLNEVLMEKYHFDEEEAKAIADFIGPLLDFDPKTRVTARDALESDWLKE